MMQSAANLLAQTTSGGTPLTAQERAARSVFVGNIPYEATEEQLKDIFTQAGPVVSFRLVYDRETGKPKGYGFCEYQDVETAQSAMRNLNNHDFNGRPLRVGVAAGEQNKDEIKGMQQAIGGLPVESPYGEVIESAKAPEAISRAVASLPPEQMFELMKQMKMCIQNNPNEARNMLLQNPQLAYALLQAEIVMKIVDPQVAIAMLHRQSDQIPPLLPTNTGDAPARPSNPPDSRANPERGPTAPPPASSPMDYGAPPMRGPPGPPPPRPGPEYGGPPAGRGPTGPPPMEGRPPSDRPLLGDRPPERGPVGLMGDRPGDPRGMMEDRRGMPGPPRGIAYHFPVA